MLIAISDTRRNERGPRHTRHILASLHAAMSRRQSVSLFIAPHSESVGLCCRFPNSLQRIIEGQFHANYPDSSIVQLADDSLGPAPDEHTWSLELRLVPELFPILRYQQFEDAPHADPDDPLNGILQAVNSDNESSLRTSIELAITPASLRRSRKAHAAVERLARPFFRTHRTLGSWYARLITSHKPMVRFLAGLFGILLAWKQQERTHDDELTKTSSRLHDNEKDLQAASMKLGQHLFEARVFIHAFGPAEAVNEARRKLHDVASVLNKLTVPRLATFRVSRIRRNGHRRSRAFLFSDQELATIWHPPTKTVGDATVHTNAWRRMEPPPRGILPSPVGTGDVCELGRVCFQDRSEPFGIRLEDRLRHVFIVGKTGMGKSTVLRGSILSDIAGGRGVALLDPHGDLAETVQACIPRERTNDVVIIDPSDRSYPVSFNPLDVAPELADVACDGIVSTFRKLFGTGTHTPRLEDILWNTVLALLLAGGTTMLDMLRMFGTDDRFRREVLSRVSNPIVRHWWQTEFESLRSYKGEDPFASVKNKLRQLLTNPIICNMVSQQRSRVNFREAMDTGKVIVINLSKGRLGERTSSFLGSLFVTQIQMAAMSRAEIPEANRREFFLYVDEFQNFATESFATILSEARKYRLGLTIANQFLDQVEVQTLNAVFGNVGSLIAFNVGPNDADTIAEQLTGSITSDDLIALPKYHAYVRLMIDGVCRPAFSMQTLEPVALSEDRDRSEIVRRVSQRRYAQSADKVEAEIADALAFV